MEVHSDSSSDADEGGVCCCTAASLSEDIPEDEFDEFEDKYNHPPDLNEDPKLVSRYGGETIRLLQPEGIHIVEHHFDTLPPDLNDESLQ